ncbi:hypothetical protein VTL71DRAFT_12700 [Oculimacula yallundae]|uniref:2EXR domain-containing protein n=1 Tax=Oculimacula yallundae TaxID=86028 RepID=A0ABR4CNA8_9HELO
MPSGIDPSLLQDLSSQTIQDQQGTLTAHANATIPSSGTTSPPLSFHMFMELPTELRDMIWKRALPAPQIHRITRRITPGELNANDTYSIQSNICPSPLLFTCKPSRRVAMIRYGRQGEDTEISSKKYFFNCETDTFYLAEFNKHLLLYISLSTRSFLPGLDRIRKVAVLGPAMIESLVNRGYWSRILWVLFPCMTLLTLVLGEDQSDYIDCEISKEDRKDVVFMDYDYLFRMVYVSPTDKPQARLRTREKVRYWNASDIHTRQPWADFQARTILEENQPTTVSEMELKFCVPRVLEQKISSVRKEYEEIDRLEKERRAPMGNAMGRPHHFNESMENLRCPSCEKCKSLSAQTR